MSNSKYCLTLIVDEEYNGRLLGSVLKNKLGLSSRQTKKAKYKGSIRINGVTSRVTDIVRTGDFVEIEFPAEESDVEPQPGNLEIIYEDDSMLVVNKDPNLVTHPTSLHPNGTLANYVAEYFSRRNIYCRIHPVNRLDRDTSGLVIFAKNPFVQEAMIKQMKTSCFEKEYLAVVHRILPMNRLIIDLPIERKETSMIERMVTANGKGSITKLETLRTFSVGEPGSDIQPMASLLSLKLGTGRTHQIRVHLSFIGHPLFGDTLYGRDDSCISRQALHCSRMSFLHPVTGKPVELTAPIPSDFQELIRVLEINQSEAFHKPSGERWWDNENPLIIRQFVNEDAKALQDFIISVYGRASSDYNTASISDIPEGSETLLLEYDGRIIAAGTLLKNEIRCLCVGQEFQRRKLGSFLLKCLENYAYCHGSELIEVSATADAIPFFEKNGYSIHGRSDLIYGKSPAVPAACRMSKMLE